MKTKIYKVKGGVIIEQAEPFSTGNGRKSWATDKVFLDEKMVKKVISEMLRKD